MLNRQKPESWVPLNNNQQFWWLVTFYNLLYCIKKLNLDFSREQAQKPQALFQARLCLFKIPSVSMQTVFVSIANYHICINRCSLCVQVWVSYVRQWKYRPSNFPGADKALWKETGPTSTVPVKTLLWKLSNPEKSESQTKFKHRYSTAASMRVAFLRKI